MVDYTKRYQQPEVATATLGNVDQGLRGYMLKVYNYMAGGLLLTGLVAFGIANSEVALKLLFGGPQAYVVMFAPLIFSFAIAFNIHKVSEGTAQALFWGFCAVMGLSLSTIFLAYTGASIARVFFITAGLFGSMSLYGYTTKKDLTGAGSFLMMGFWGIFIASMVNLFMQSEAISYIVSCVGVVVFTGLAAYSTQQIKELYYIATPAERGKAAVMGAYTLYINFINLMMMLLRLFGDRR